MRDLLITLAKRLHYHPKEFMAHTGRIRLAARVYQDWDLATDYCRKAQEALRTTGFEPELERFWFELQQKS
jgi:hypothetical protein